MTAAASVRGSLPVRFKTLALISVNVNTMSGSRTPIKLGGYFVDDVQLTVIQQPKLPVQVVKE